MILEYRGVAKLKSTYTDKLPEQINERTGRIHTSLSAGGGGDRPVVLLRPEPAEHSDPHARGAAHPPGVHAPPGYSLVAADYSQIELRIMAHLSGDASLLNAFAEDRDIHQATAAEVLGMPLGAGERRSAALGQGGEFRIDLRHVGLRPCASARHLARRCATLCGAVLRALSGREALHGRDARPGARAGYVETVFGRRLYLPEIRSRNARCASMPNAARSTRRCKAPRRTSSSAP